METKEIKHLQNIKKENKSLILFHEVKKSVICPKILLNNSELSFSKKKLINKTENTNFNEK